MDFLALLLRIGLYLVLAWLAQVILPAVMLPIGGYVVAASLGTFAAGALANAVVLRIFERGQLADIGLNWNVASRYNLLLGMAGGVAAGLLVTLIPLAVGAARLIPSAAFPFRWGTPLFMTVVLAFGVVGEEMLFRGYAFQVLASALSPLQALLPLSILFGFAHLGNPNVTWLGLINTVAWGLLLGYAFLRSGDLWLPIGLHFGWNWVLPMFGVNLSGLTIVLTGYVMQWKAGWLWSGGDYGPEGSLLTLFAIAGLLFAVRRAPVRTQRVFLFSPAPEV